MTVSQISVFAQSQPGHLARLLRVFQAAQVSVRGYSVSDTGEFGITRFILSDPAAASDALRAEGLAFVESPVICIELPDVPGELARVMELLADAGQNVLYSYSMISTYIIIATDDIQATKDALAGSSFTTIDQATITKINASRIQGGTA